MYEVYFYKNEESYNSNNPSWVELAPTLKEVKDVIRKFQVYDKDYLNKLYKITNQKCDATYIQPEQFCYIENLISYNDFYKTVNEKDKAFYKRYFLMCDLSNTLYYPEGVKLNEINDFTSLSFSDLAPYLEGKELNRIVDYYDNIDKYNFNNLVISDVLIKLRSKIDLSKLKHDGTLFTTVNHDKMLLLSNIPGGTISKIEATSYYNRLVDLFNYDNVKKEIIKENNYKTEYNIFKRIKEFKKIKDITNIDNLNYIFKLIDTMIDLGFYFFSCSYDFNSIGFVLSFFIDNNYIEAIPLMFKYASNYLYKTDIYYFYAKLMANNLDKDASSILIEDYYHLFNKYNNLDLSSYNEKQIIKYTSNLLINLDITNINRYLDLYKVYYKNKVIDEEYLSNLSKLYNILLMTTFNRTDYTDLLCKLLVTITIFKDIKENLKFDINKLIKDNHLIDYDNKLFNMVVNYYLSFSYLDSDLLSSIKYYNLLNYDYIDNNITRKELVNKLGYFRDIKLIEVI